MPITASHYIIFGTKRHFTRYGTTPEYIFETTRHFTKYKTIPEYIIFQKSWQGRDIYYVLETPELERLIIPRIRYGILKNTIKQILKEYS
jgi:hypothetical protein